MKTVGCCCPIVLLGVIGAVVAVAAAISVVVPVAVRTSDQRARAIAQ